MFELLQEALSTFLSYIPQLIGAIVILVIGYVIARVLQAVVGRVLQGIGFDGWMERGGIKQFFDRAETNQTPASILGALVFWFVFIIAITMAADALGIPQISVVLAQLIAYIPSIIAAILILILAALLANFIIGIVRGGDRERHSVEHRPVREHRVCSFCSVDAAWGGGAADREHLLDPARGSGVGGGDSIRDRRPG